MGSTSSTPSSKSYPRHGWREGESPNRLASLGDLDVVLIRSAAQLNGVRLDYQTARGLQHYTNARAFETTVEVERWDRVGLLSVPEWTSAEEKEAFSPDALMVTEATAEGVRTSSLKEVCEGAADVSIRPLRVQVPPEDVRAAVEDLEARAAVRGDGARRRVSSRALRRRAEEEAERRARINLLSRWYPFSGPLANRPWADVLDAPGLKPMLTFAAMALDSYHADGEDETLVGALIDRADPRGEGLDLEALLRVLHDMAAEPELVSPLSHGDIVELTHQMESHTGALHGHVTRAEFMRSWRRAMRRTVDARRQPRQIVSGSFVSLALQRIGLLPEGDSHFFEPIEFSQYRAGGRGRARPGAAEGALLGGASLGDEVVVVSGSVL